jgi:carboxyl-terminal processing protease
MSQRNLLLLLGALLLSYACYVRAEQNPYARYLAAGFSTIDRWALVDPPNEELFNGAMHGMVKVLHDHGDKHSEFIDARQEAAYREQYDQEFGGVGIRLRLLGEPPLPTVIGLPQPGTPAFSADVRLGDRLEAVDGQSTAGMELNEVTKLVRGPVGEPVALTLQRREAAAPHTATIERAIITVESVLGDVRDADGNWNFIISDEPRIGYVRIVNFGDKTAAEMSSALESIDAETLAGLVIDVRDDPGGSLEAAVEVCDLFLRPGLTIVTTRGREGEAIEASISTGTGRYVDLPLAVLVDRNSASASEIVAACLQDHGRAVVVGGRTYGKGTVQRLTRIESGRSLLKLTSATYARPSGANIHRMPGDDVDAEWGVSPDPGFDVPLNKDEYRTWRQYRVRRDLMGAGADPQLAAELSREDGEVTADFTDQALARAVEYLESRAPSAVEASSDPSL